MTASDNLHKLGEFPAVRAALRWVDTPGNDSMVAKEAEEHILSAIEELTDKLVKVEEELKRAEDRAEQANPDDSYRDGGCFAATRSAMALAEAICRVPAAIEIDIFRADCELAFCLDTMYYHMDIANRCKAKAADIRKRRDRLIAERDMTEGGT